MRELSSVPEDVRLVFVSAHEVAPEWHVRMQAAFQEHTDNAVSKTVNLPQDASVSDVEELYMLAYQLGCKGVTMYRYGSRPSQVLYRGHGASSPGLKPRERQKVTAGTTEKVKIGCGNLYITVNSDEQGICEVFTSLGRAGGCPSQSEATSRLVSLGLRSGIDIAEITEQLKGIRCMSSIRSKQAEVLSCPDAIGRAIERYLERFGVDLDLWEAGDGEMLLPGVRGEGGARGRMQGVPLLRVLPLRAVVSPGKCMCPGGRFAVCGPSGIESQNWESTLHGRRRRAAQRA